MDPNSPYPAGGQAPPPQPVSGAPPPRNSIPIPPRTDTIPPPQRAGMDFVQSGPSQPAGQFSAAPAPAISPQQQPIVAPPPPQPNPPLQAAATQPPIAPTPPAPTHVQIESTEPDPIPTTQPSAPLPSAQPTTTPLPSVQTPPTELPKQPETIAQAQTVKKFKQPKSVMDFLKPVVALAVFFAAVVGVAAIINSFVFQSYYVDGTSMTPTLQSNDRLIIEKISRSGAVITRRPYIPKRGEIIVLDSSIVSSSGKEEQLIKRLIGLPGDVITLKEGKVFVKNKESPEGFDVDEKLGLKFNNATFAPEENSSVTVPPDHVYVLGDNRGPGGSYDSRTFGTVPAGRIEGRLWARILPINKSGIF